MNLLQSFATGGLGAGILLCAQILIKGWLNRRKTSADARLTEVNGELTLSKAALDFLAAVRLDAEKQILAARADATAQIAGARADAANSMAQSMHEVATARGDVGQVRAEAAQMRNTVERIEQLLLWVRAEVWRPIDPALIVGRVQERLGDGSTPLSVLINGSPR